MDSGQVQTPDLLEMIRASAEVDVRMAVVRADDGWTVLHGELAMSAIAAQTARTWRYGQVAFLERVLPGALVASLMGGEAQDIEGSAVVAEVPSTTGSF